MEIESLELSLSVIVDEEDEEGGVAMAVEFYYF